MRIQEGYYLEAITNWLQIKERELQKVINEIEIRAASADYKETIISKLEQSVGRLEREGHQVMNSLIQ
jgi:hypothetical protein